MKYKTTYNNSAGIDILRTPHFYYIARLKYDYEVCHYKREKESAR